MIRSSLTVASLVLLSVFASVLAAAQQQPPTVTAQANTVYVGADGKFEAPPDTALIQFNISAQEDSARAASDRAQKAADQIRQILRSNGIDPKDAQIGFFSIQPVYDYRKPTRKLVGYRVNSSVTLKLKDFSKVAPITQQLADMDVTENTNVNYTLENIDNAKIRAVQDAFQRARAEAAAVAQAGGRTLGELSYASVDTYEQVRVLAQPMRAMATAEFGAAKAQATAPVPQDFTPQEIVVTAHVNTMFTIR
jgi:uncharacterized protein YggE